MIDLKKTVHFPVLSSIGRIADDKQASLYAVGGFVRDFFLGREITEIDFVTEGDGPAFARYACRKLNGRGLVVFRRFGTASFLLNALKLEFVSARKESYSKDSRKPRVSAGDLMDDLSRRDFTINTMAIRLNAPGFGQLMDPFSGQSDLKREIIRTPLKPASTFSDDPLRMMRAVRFACQLGFHIEKQTFRAINRERERLRIVSRERITDEFLKIMSCPRPSAGLRILLESGLLDIVFPELSDLAGVEQRDTYHHKDVFEHTVKVVDNLAAVTDNIPLRFAGLVHDIGKPRVKRFVKGTGWTFHGHEQVGVRMLKTICDRMRLPGEYYRISKKLTQLHMRPIHLIDESVTDSAIRRLIVQAGEQLDSLMTLCRADITSGNPGRVKKHLANFDHIVHRMSEVEEKDRMRAFQSPVRGEEIMAACGIGPGPAVGKLKKMIEEAILDGIIPNDHDAAFDYLLGIKDDALE